MSDFIRDADKYGQDAERYAEQHPQQADKVVDRAGQEVDERTDDRYQGQTQEAEKFVENHIGGDEQRR